MKYDYNTLFEGIKNSLNDVKTRNNGVSYDKVIKISKPKAGDPALEYMVRILPYIKEGKEGLHKTFFYYAKYFWQDELGKYQSVLSRRTFNEPCIITNYYYQVLRSGNDYEKENISRLKYKQGWYCNVYVISDPTTPSNNGKVMVLSLNKTLYLKVQAAINGDLDEEWSTRMTDANPEGKEIHVNVGRLITDLSDNGVNLALRVTDKGGFPDYNSSEFTRRNARLHLTEEQQDEILDACVDVSNIERELSAEEIARRFKESFLHQTVLSPVGEQHIVNTAISQPKPTQPKTTIFDEDDQIPGLETPTVKPETSAIDTEKTSVPSQSSAINTEDEMDEFLHGYTSGKTKFDFS